MTSPHTEKKKDAFIRTFGRDHSPWGSAPYRWDVDIVDQDATSDDWTISRARGSFDLLVWHVWHDAGWPRRGNVPFIWWLSCPKRANVSPEGLDVLSFCSFLQFKHVKSDKSFKTELLAMSAILLT